MYVGCDNCGYTAHASKAAGEYCPQCGKKLRMVMDTREIDDSGKKGDDWKKYQELKKQFGGS